MYVDIISTAEVRAMNDLSDDDFNYYPIVNKLGIARIRSYLIKYGKGFSVRSQPSMECLLAYCTEVETGIDRFSVNASCEIGITDSNGRCPYLIPLDMDKHISWHKSAL